jgi:pyruvate dehydrogenase E2 component (dihydrolipoamide acetyltransferase)
MVKDVTLPEISENVNTGIVIGVLVSRGDSVKKDDPLVELETEKAAFEVPAPFAGTVNGIAVHEGDEVKVGQVIVKLEVGEKEGGEEEPSTRKTEEEEREAGEREKKEKGGEGEGEKIREKAEGAGPDEESQEEGKKREAEPGAEEEEQRKTAGERAKAGERIEESGDIDESGRVPAPASPSVRRLARELGVNIDQVQGSGPGGRISSSDVKEFTKRTIERGAGPADEEPVPDFTAWGEVSREPMSGVRKATARSVSTAWRRIPHVTQYDRADITELERFRKEYAPNAEDAGGKLTVTAILLKVTASALQLFRQFNASIDMDKREIIYKHYIHIGVAVDTERGLLVPVVRDVDEKSMVQLAAELTAIAEKARNKKIKPDEMQGGTFTLSNLGGIGGTGFAPVVFWPQVAILGVSRAHTEAVFRDGEFEPRLVLPLSLSYDHRVIDGADGTRFLHWIKEALEKPLLMLLEGS